MQNDTQVDTQAILAQTKELENQKASAIVALLGERETLNEETQRRLDEIKDELKALGYKAPRQKKTVDNSAATN